MAHFCVGLHETTLTIPPSIARAISLALLELHPFS